ncbi:DUF6232 family protein [Actinoplanes sp. NPDC051633]|uniref:DUF6232 family protein n=1 Tax=Actinoplanes sp. NPDC051633 TaxID=3155670 RepID=UPI0034268584
MSTRTYYRGPDAVVTSELFVWRTKPARIFVIRELGHVGITCGDPDRARPHTTHAAAGSAALAIAVWLIVDAPVLLVATCLAVALPVAAIGAYWRLRPRLWRLHATYRGDDVVLYASTNGRVFNQVIRALRRAIEDLPHDDVWHYRAA